jgi:hypothetical protein
VLLAIKDIVLIYSTVQKSTKWKASIQATIGKPDKSPESPPPGAHFKLSLINKKEVKDQNGNKVYIPSTLNYLKAEVFDRGPLSGYTQSGFLNFLNPILQKKGTQIGDSEYISTWRKAIMQVNQKQHFTKKQQKQLLS